MVEGVNVLRAALDAGVAIESVYIDPSGAGPEVDELVDRVVARGGRAFELDVGVLARVADTVTPQPVLAVVADVGIALAQLGRQSPHLVLICADVRDPGNAGNVLRSAEASGASGVVFGDGSVDVWNPKTVRASAGAVFQVPVVSGGPMAEVLDEVRAWGLQLLGTAATGGRPYTAVDLCRPTALVLGNEAHGLTDAATSRLDGLVTIPMDGRAESLNVGMAAAVLCFEAARQRHLAVRP